MQQPYRRALLVALAIILTALIFLPAIAASRSFRGGGSGPTFAMAASPFLALVGVLGALVISLAVAGVVGRLLNAVVGLFVLGCGVGLLSMRSGTIRDVVFGGASLSGLAVEGFFWTILLVACAEAVFRMSGPLPDAVEIEEPRIDGRLGSRTLLALLAGLLTPLCVAMIASSPSKGQALGAVIVGSMLTGLAGRLIAPRSAPVLLFAAPVFFGSIGYLIASMRLGAESLDLAFVTRMLSHLAYPTPVDYAAGSLIGVSLGIGWSRSFLKLPSQATESA